MQLPEEEKYLTSREELINQITVMLGGRSAEEEVFDLVSTGASNDIERATQQARSMVSIYGMSDRFDMMALESVQNRYLDGRAVRNCSEETSTILDEETLRIIKHAHANARQILRDNRDLLDKISEVLLEKETIFGEEFFDLVYEKYPEMKEEKEKEKSENEKRVKELAERRAKKHALDIVIDDKPEKSQRDFQDLGKSELTTSNQTPVIWKVMRRQKAQLKILMMINLYLKKRNLIKRILN